MTTWSKDELRKIAEADDLHIAPFREDGVTFSVHVVDRVWPKSEISSGRRVNGGSAAHRPTGQKPVRTGAGSGNRGGILEKAGTSPRALS